MNIFQKKKSLAILLLLSVITHLTGFSQSKDPKKPNVVFILADDLGWKDVSFMGSKFYQTPNIDALSKKGMVFTNAYTASPLCSPSRASIMTGLYPSKTGIVQANCHINQVRLYAGVSEKAPPTHNVLQVVSSTRLKLDYYTLGEAFKDAGYTTAHIGKWHLGLDPYNPQNQGFDIDIPHTGAESPTHNGWFAPWPVWPGHGKPGENLEDGMANEAVKFIKTHKDKPFLLDYWSFSVHAPWDAKQNLIKKYDALADSTYPQHNPVYAGMVETFDDAVGRIVKTLKEEGILDNTIIVFYSDNGGVNWTEKGNIQPAYENIPITSNAPLRAGKATDYNGGIHVPCIVWWPNHTKPNTINNSIISGVDIYPTLLDMCNIQKRVGIKFDGVSFTPALEGKPFNQGPIFAHFPIYIKKTNQVPATAVIDRDWKLIRDYFDNDDHTDRFELYNLKDDIGEQNNLADKMPQKVAEMNRLITKFLDDSGAVIPRPNLENKK